MDKERTACWPRHKRRAYAQAEGFESPQREDYRRLLNFLANNSDLCQKAILHSKSLPEFAAVKTILNRRVRVPQETQAQEVDLIAEQLLDSGESQQDDLLPNTEQPDLVSPDEKSVLEVLEEENKDWQDVSDLLEELPTEDLFHSKLPGRGRFGRKRVSTSLSKLIVEHALNPQEEAELDSIQTLEPILHQNPIKQIEALDIPQEVIDQFIEEKRHSLESEIPSPADLESGPSLELKLEESPQTDSKNARHFLESLSSAITSEAQSIDETKPVSQTQQMLEEWFSAIDETQESDSSEEEIDQLAHNPKRLLKQLELIANKENSDAPKQIQKILKPTIKPCLVHLDNGNRKELYQNGALVIKDSIGKVLAVRSQDGIVIKFNHKEDAGLTSFVRYESTGEIHSTGERDKHGVVVRDPCGRVRAQGESMTCDPKGCLTIRKLDGQFWCIDLVREIHIERRILEDLYGNWSSLTALLSFDGFRMATKFQELTDSYRKYGDWLSNNNSSTFRFYGRDGSMIQFNSDEELQSLRPSSTKPSGSKPVDEELKGHRQARTAWDSVHEYVSHYLATL